MTSAEQEYAETLARVIAADVSANPAEGTVARVVLRWSDEADPLYFTVHVLGADERAAVSAEDAWYPLEWEDVDRELDRTDRVADHPDVQRDGGALAVAYEEADDAEDAGEPTAPVAVVDAIRRLPDAFRAAGVDLAPDFAASASHFEGWGALDVLRVVTPDALVGLGARGELPAE